MSRERQAIVIYPSTLIRKDLPQTRMPSSLSRGAALPVLSHPRELRLLYRAELKFRVSGRGLAHPQMLR
jgi:hypothetical protein